LIYKSNNNENYYAKRAPPIAPSISKSQDNANKAIMADINRNFLTIKNHHKGKATSHDLLQHENSTT
jgi:hypothetical protein